MSNYSQQIRKFNRFELKYLITLQQAQDIKRTLYDYMQPDENGQDDDHYAITSLYYDSPDSRCYWEKEHGIKIRRKLRIRYYGSGGLLTDETTVFLEIKQRVDRVTQKRRAMLPYFEALRLCNNRQIPEVPLEDKPLIDEAFVFLWKYNLIPACIIHYDRQALVGTTYDPGLRVTFDTNITFQVHPLHLHETSSNLPLISPNKVIMEIKVNERMPYWLTELIAVKNLSMVRVSKYCSAVEAAQAIPLIHKRKPLAETADEALSSAFSVPIFWEKIQKEKIYKKEI